MIRSSLESKIYILPGICLRDQIPVTGPARVRWLIALAILLILAWMAYRVWGLSFDWRRFIITFQQLDWRWVGIAICFILFGNLPRAWRWEVMLRPTGASVGIWKLISDTAIGFAAVMLFGRVGEVVRPYLIASDAELPFSSQAAAWMLERMLDLLAVLLMFGFALIRIPSQFTAVNPQIQRGLEAGGFVFAIFAFVCLGVLVAFRNFPALAQVRILSGLKFLRPEAYRRVEDVLKKFSEGLECTRSSKLLAALLAYTAMLWAVIIGDFYALLHSFPATAQFGIGDVVILLGFMSFGALLQIPGIGGGIQVASIVAFTGIYRVRLEAASGAAILLWAVPSMVIVTFGLACAFQKGLNWSKLKLLSTKQIIQ